MSHHPSCTPDDRVLIYKCIQCGEEETAEAIRVERDEALARERAAVAKTWQFVAFMVCEWGHPELKERCEAMAKRAEEGKS